MIIWINTLIKTKHNWWALSKVFVWSRAKAAEIFPTLWPEDLHFWQSHLSREVVQKQMHVLQDCSWSLSRSWLCLVAPLTRGGRDGRRQPTLLPEKEKHDFLGWKSIAVVLSLEQVPGSEEQVVLSLGWNSVLSRHEEHWALLPCPPPLLAYQSGVAAVGYNFVNSPTNI